jgi:hypothetical protein
VADGSEGFVNFTKNVENRRYFVLYSDRHVLELSYVNVACL